MTYEKRAKASQLRGFLEMLREKTQGADERWVDLMHEADSGRMIWIGGCPGPKKKRKSK